MSTSGRPDSLDPRRSIGSTLLTYPNFYGLVNSGHNCLCIKRTLAIMPIIFDRSSSLSMYRHHMDKESCSDEHIHKLEFAYVVFPIFSMGQSKLIPHSLDILPASQDYNAGFALPWAHQGSGSCSLPALRAWLQVTVLACTHLHRHEIQSPPFNSTYETQQCPP